MYNTLCQLQCPSMYQNHYKFVLGTYVLMWAREVTHSPVFSKCGHPSGGERGGNPVSESGECRDMEPVSSVSRRHRSRSEEPRAKLTQSNTAQCWHRCCHKHQGHHQQVLSCNTLQGRSTCFSGLREKEKWHLRKVAAKTGLNKNWIARIAREEWRLKRARGDGEQWIMTGDGRSLWAEMMIRSPGPGTLMAVFTAVSCLQRVRAADSAEESVDVIEGGAVTLKCRYVTFLIIILNSE